MRAPSSRARALVGPRRFRVAPFVFVPGCHARGECARVRRRAPHPCPDPAGLPGSHRGQRAAALCWREAGRRRVTWFRVPRLGGPRPGGPCRFSRVRGLGRISGRRLGRGAAGRRRHCGWCWAAGRGLEASAPGRTETSGASRAGGAAGTDGAVVGARGDVGTWGRTARSWGRPRSRGAQVPCSAGACGRCWDPRGPECRDGATAGWGRLRAGPFTGGCFLAPPGLYLSGTFPFRSIFKRRCLPQAASLDVFGCEPRSGPVEGLGPYG